MASLLKLWVYVQAHLFQLTASSSSFKGQAGNLPGAMHAAQIIPLSLQLGSNHSLWWLSDPFSFVMLRSANRGHWRDNADSMVPTEGSAVPSDRAADC